MSKEKEMNEELFYKKAKYYSLNKIPVHIKLVNGFYYNGIILEVTTDYFILDDEKINEFPVWFSEVIKLEVKKTREEVGV